MNQERESEHNKERRWRQLTLDGVQDPPCYLTPEDECYYAREYVSEGWVASPTNQLIANFKISPSNSHRLHHKESAIQQFAFELYLLFQYNAADFLDIAFIPTSKIPGHQDYDDRNDRLKVELEKRLVGKIRFHNPISCHANHQSSHLGGSRSPDILSQYLKWNGFETNEPDVLIVIDDVLTTGGHFKAFKKLLTDHSSVKVVGVFWAKTNRQIDSIL